MRIVSRFTRHSALLLWCLSVSPLLFGLTPSPAAAADKAAAPAAAQPAEQAVREALPARVNEYWQYKIAGDLEKAYLFEDPESLAGTTVTDYVRAIGGAVKWLGAEVQSVTVAGDVAKVVVSIRYYWTFVKGEAAEQGVTSQAVEFWRLRDGVWFHRFVDPRKMRGPTDDAGGGDQTNPPPAATEGATKP